MKFTLIPLFIALFLGMVINAQSVYKQKPTDTEAHFFLVETYIVKADGKQDVSEALQFAINKLKEEQNFGVLFIPEGKYLISKTIYIPKAIRLIGYGKNRPEFILAENSPGFQNENNYMFWFTSNLVNKENPPRDATAGTFYSAISNINFRISNGNPKAIALRTHFAQHSFVSHCNFYIGNAYAGIYDLGNEIENLKFYGGEYAITTGRTAPGWPMMMLDLYCENQRKGAIISRNTGMTILNLHIKNTPVAIELEKGTADRLYMENCLFENVDKGLIVGAENQAVSQVNLLNITCSQVKTPVYFSQSGKEIKGKGEKFLVKSFVHGIVMDSMTDNSNYKTLADIVEISKVPTKVKKLIPNLPEMKVWRNVKDFGAIGDGITDDTEAIQKAINTADVIYFPTGWYRITQTVKLNSNTSLIGMHPYATQLVLNESEQAFSGFGSPVPVLESSVAGNNMVNGIGINTAAYNNRAVGLKWMANENSLVNDVKFVGGHGNMAKPGQSIHHKRRNKNISTTDSPVYETGKDLAWDNQYWSLWVTNNGGGIFKDIWTASTYASAGLYVSNTSTKGKVYAMSLEHHVRQEARLNNIKNWKFYAFQFEEEAKEGKKAHTLTIENSENLSFVNLWMYRTIRVKTPREWGIKVSNCKNIDFRNMRSWTQVLHLPERTIYDMDKGLVVFAGDFALSKITGKENPTKLKTEPVKINKLAYGFEFATGAVSDSKGNVYFCEHQQKRIYKWSATDSSLSILADYPYKPLSLIIDTEDNLLVICRYDLQQGFNDKNKPITIELLPDNVQYYSGWGNGGWACLAYAINLNTPDNMQKLELIKTHEAKNVKRVVHPTHRWRNNFDSIVTALAPTSFLAPDGVTIIPNTFDLARSVQLTTVEPNQKQKVYVTHEDTKTTYAFNVGEMGKLENMTMFVKRGEYSNITDSAGNLYLCEGEILIYNKVGKETGRIKHDDRIQSITWGGENHNTLFVTTSSAFYMLKH